MEVRFGEQSHKLRIVGLLEATTALEKQSLGSLFLTDIATAQAVLGLRGRLSSIQMKITGDESQLDAVEALLPATSVWLEGKLNRKRSLLSVTQAFQTNLTALSMLTLLVAVFLIYNTTTFLVMRREPRIRVFRALGVTQREVVGCIALEAILIGIIASVIGFAFGVYLSKTLLALVERSINNLYFPITAEVTLLSPSAVTVAIFLGVCITLLSAVPAMRESMNIKFSFSTTEPLTRSSISSRRLTLLITSAICLLVGISAMQLNSRSIGFGFASIFLIISGLLCLVPILCELLSRYLRKLGKSIFGVRGVLASRAFVMTGGRTPVAICALCLAVSTTVGVGAMIGSFRVAVDNWLGDRLTADVYVTFEDRGDQLSDREIEKFKSIPGVNSVGVANWSRLSGPNGESRVFAVDYGEASFWGYRFKDRVEQQLWERFETEGVIVSEPYSWRHQVGVGDYLEFWQEGAKVKLPVLGIYYDYSSDRGVVSIHRDVYISNFEDEKITAAAIFAEENIDLVDLKREVNESISSPGTTVWSGRGLHDASMEIFDQTFAITAVLRSLAIVVAFISVLSVLAMIQIDRENELRIQKAVGFSTRQIWGLASAESGVMGLLAGLLALPVGLLITWLLIWVINQRSFGWTMELQLDLPILLDAIVLSVGAALLASLVPAWRLAKRASAKKFFSGAIVGRGQSKVAGTGRWFCHCFGIDLVN